MELGAKVQFIKNVVSNIDNTFRMYEKGIVSDREHGMRGAIKDTWYLIKFDKFDVPYWCLENELKLLKD